MDIGVGSFIFAQGLMQARKPLADAWSLFVQQFRQTVIHCVPLFALGIIRLIAVKGSNYQEHASEYGIHWNFFFTLAFLPSIVLCLRFIFAWLNDIALGAIIVSGSYIILHLQISCKFHLRYFRVSIFIVSRPFARLDFECRARRFTDIK
jgi:phosphatidylinositol glycan class W